MTTSQPPQRLVERPNKTALKKEHQQVQQFAESLVKKPALLKTKVELPEHIRQQIALAQKIKGNAYRRQIKHIANQIIQQGDDFVDFIMSDTAPVNTLGQPHPAEQLAESLINGNNSLQQELVEQFSSIERQHLGNLIRQARREKSKNRPMKAAKTLVHYLKENML